MKNSTLQPKPLAYAGIGSRSTPVEVCDFMRGIAATLSERGWMLRSGHAEGADQAFEDGCTGAKEIYIPWQGFHNGRHKHNDTFAVHCLSNHLQALDIAGKTHPNWSACGNATQMLITGTVYQILGIDLDSKVEMVICWIKDGNPIGDTGQAIRLANILNIPVFNLFNEDAINRLQDFVFESEK